MFSSVIQAVISKYNNYYYKVECKSCKQKFLRDKRCEIRKNSVCSIQCFLNFKQNIV